MAKKALGKGIDALFNEGSAAAVSPLPGRERGDASVEGRIIEIGVDDLQMNPDQPRKRFDEVSIFELSASIKKHGVLQPIIVRKGGGDKYAIVAGERRYRAARLADLKTIPAVVMDLDESGGLQVALVENLQREDLSPIEEARAYRELMDLSGAGQEQVAEAVGKNRSTVANSLRLLKLPGEMQEALSGGDLSAGHARALLAVVNPTDRQSLFKRLSASPMSVREAEEVAARLNSGRRTTGKTRSVSGAENPDAELADLERRLLDRYSTKVRIRGSGEGGRIEIHYFSAGDLERVLGLLLEE